MTHPLRVAENCTTHPLHKAQNLMTHPLSAPAHPPPLLFDQSLSLRYCDSVDLCKDCQFFKKQTSLKCLVCLFLIWALLLRFMPALIVRFIISKANRIIPKQRENTYSGNSPNGHSRKRKALLTVIFTKRRFSQLPYKLCIFTFP